MAAKPAKVRKQHTVAALAASDAGVFELAVPCEVFGLDRSELVSPWYRFKVCAPTKKPGKVSTNSGFTVLTEYGLDDVATADTVIVCAGHYERINPQREIIEALQAAHARGARIASLCTGAFLLAAAGLLDGRRATTHWMHAEELAAQYPAVEVDPKVLYIDEGDVLTSAGTAAGIDLCLHIVRKDHGADVANAVARRMVVPPHRDGGQAQYVDIPVAATEEGDPLSRTLGWMLEHLSEPLSVDALAHRSHMSPRTFARRFRAVTGTTPHQWLLSQRIMLAQRLLETSDLPVELVAERCGFGTAANLRHHFQRVVDTSPLAYRRTFRAEAG
jgi:transcriptional regulator GlxA family with amidase domain